MKEYFPVKSGMLNKLVLKAVDGVSFTIDEGETLGLVGESGCGKTTVGRTLLHLYKPTAGEVYFDGKQVTEKNIGGFLLSQLEFLHKGGRCSSISLLGANLLNIKPSIVVKDGAMSVAKKYRGKDEICRLKYMKDRIAEFDGQIDTSRIILHTTCDLSEKEIKGYKKELKKLIECDEIIVSTAGCVITSHCGPGTFSLFFMLK